MGDHKILKGPVRYSQAIHNHHTVQVTLNDGGCVQNVKCDCMAGRGCCCSHAAAVLYKVKAAVTRGLTGMSCTDQLCQWNRSTWVNILPDTVENLQTVENPQSLKILSKSFASDAEVVKHLTSPDMAGLASIPGTILNHLMTGKPPKGAESEVPKVHSNCVEQNCELCLSVFEKYVVIDEEMRKQIEEKTKGQDSQLWMDQRKIRITSSEAAKVPLRKDPVNWIERKLNGKFTGSDATRHGQACEPLARKWFEEKMGVSIQTTGLIIDKEESWLGASLDGIVDSDTILEIKCPTPKKLEAHNGSMVKMVQSNTYDVKYINGSYVLRGGYHCQVQLAMHCSQKKHCKFLVWSPTEQIIVDVQYNRAWAQEKITHLRKVYFEHVLPAIATRITHGVMKVCVLKKK